jgi:hypothetical protein
MSLLNILWALHLAHSIGFPRWMGLHPLSPLIPQIQTCSNLCQTHCEAGDENRKYVLCILADFTIEFALMFCPENEATVRGQLSYSPYFLVSLYISCSFWPITILTADDLIKSWWLIMSMTSYNLLTSISTHWDRPTWPYSTIWW